MSDMKPTEEQLAEFGSMIEDFYLSPSMSPEEIWNYVARIVRDATLEEAADRVNDVLERDYEGSYNDDVERAVELSIKAVRALKGSDNAK